MLSAFWGPFSRAVRKPTPGFQDQLPLSCLVFPLHCNASFCIQLALLPARKKLQTGQAQGDYVNKMFLFLPHLPQLAPRQEYQGFHSQGCYFSVPMYGVIGNWGENDLYGQ